MTPYELESVNLTQEQFDELELEVTIDTDHEFDDQGPSIDDSDGHVPAYQISLRAQRCLPRMAMRYRHTIDVILWKVATLGIEYISPAELKWLDIHSFLCGDLEERPLESEQSD